MICGDRESLKWIISTIDWAQMKYADKIRATLRLFWVQRRSAAKSSCQEYERRHRDRNRHRTYIDLINKKENPEKSETWQNQCVVLREPRCAEAGNEQIGESCADGMVIKEGSRSLIFIDLRDRSGMMQLLFDENNIGEEGFKKRKPFVISICDRGPRTGTEEGGLLTKI